MSGPLGAAVDAQVDAGGSIEDLLAGLGVGTAAHKLWVGGVGIRRAWWPHVYPHAGVEVVALLAPAGGGGAGGGKNPLRTILTIAVLAGAVAVSILTGGVATPFFGSAILGSLAGAAAAAAVSVGGYFLINALAPPPSPRLGSSTLGGDRFSAAYGLTGSRNSATPYGTVPRIFGRHKVYPPLAALPYTEIRGDDQYLRMVFCVGHGPLQLSDLRIGDTPIGSFQSVQVETREGAAGEPPLTLFPLSAEEQPLSVLLLSANPPSTRTTPINIDEVSVDVTFPQGLVQFDSAGGKLARSVRVQVNVDKVGGGYSTVLFGNYTDSRATTIRRNLFLAVPRGQYVVTVRRVTPDSTGQQIFDQVAWTTLRTFRNEEPVALAGMARVALVIKATDQINGVVDQFNCLAEAKLPTYDGAAVTAPIVTRNPAWAYLEVLRGAANKRPVADARIDLAAIRAWAGACDAEGRTFDAVLDFKATVFETLRNIAGVGRAAFAMPEGRYSVVRDVKQTTIVQHFTPRNSREFKGVRAYRDVPHALKVRFVNPDAQWRQDERIVYDDGFDQTNATRFETLDLIGCTKSDLAFKDGRYHLATLRLRPELYELTVDVENLLCTRGDLVRVTHDGPLFGLSSGRVKTVQTDGFGNCTGFTSDEGFPYDISFQHAVRVRLADGSSLLRDVVNNNGFITANIFEVPIPAGEPFPAAGDLVLFGRRGGESVELVVRNVEPLDDLAARITLVDHAPAVYAADQGPIPAYDPQITRPPDLNAPPPPVPVVQSIKSDESVLIRGADGTLQSRILVSLATIPVSTITKPRDLQAQFRPSDADVDAGWFPLPYQSAELMELSVVPVEDGQTYDVRLRYVSADSVASDWTTVFNHFVVGKTSPPPDVAPLRIEDRVVKWAYPDEPPDFDGFKVRHRSGNSPVWSAGIDAFDGLVTATFFDVSVLPAGVRTVMVKAVDTSGNESVNVSYLILNLGDPELDNVLAVQDERVGGWTGTKTNCTVVTGDLKADSETDGYFWPGEATAILWPVLDSDPFWPAADSDDLWPDVPDLTFWNVDDAALFWQQVFKAMRYEVFFIPGLGLTPSRLTVPVEVTAGVYSLTYRGDGSDDLWPIADADFLWPATDPEFFWPDNLDPFLPWPGQIDAAHQRYDFRLDVEGGPVQGDVAQMKFELDVPDVVEELPEVSVSGITTRLPITKTYRVISTVSLTLFEDGGLARTAKWLDKDPNLGPLVEVFDSSNLVTSGKVDARVKGY